MSTAFHVAAEIVFITSVINNPNVRQFASYSDK